MGAVFVTGVGTEVGKTWITAALIRALRQAGRPVDAFKPVISGFDPERAGESDAGVLLDALGREAGLEAVEAIAPFRYAAPMSPPLAAAREGRPLEFRAVAAACRAKMAAAGDDLLLIEGAGGLMSPLAESGTVLDLIQALDVPVLLVAATYLGAISHTLTALEVLHWRQVRVRAVAVNESAEAGASLEETCASLRALAPAAPLAAVRRDGDVGELVGLI